MVDICDTIFSQCPHALTPSSRSRNMAHCHRQLEHVDMSLNPSRCCTTAHRSSLAYFLLLFHIPLYVAICIPSPRSCRSVKFVAQRWTCIKVIVGGDLKEYNTPAFDVVSSHSRRGRRLHGRISLREIPLSQHTLLVTT